MYFFLKVTQENQSYFSIITTIIVSIHYYFVACY